MNSTWEHRRPPVVAFLVSTAGWFLYPRLLLLAPWERTEGEWVLVPLILLLSLWGCLAVFALVCGVRCVFWSSSVIARLGIAIVLAGFAVQLVCFPLSFV